MIVTYEQGNKTFYCVGKVNRDVTEIEWQGAEAGKLFSIPTKEPSISMNENGLVVVAAETCDISRIRLCSASAQWKEQVILHGRKSIRLHRRR